MLRGALLEAHYFLRLCKLGAINVTGKEVASCPLVQNKKVQEVSWYLCRLCM